MPPKNNITKKEVDRILNKDGQEVYDILNKNIDEVLPLVKTLSEEILADLISIDKRKRMVTVCTHRLNYLTKYASLDYLIDRYKEGEVDKGEICNRMNMSKEALDCAIAIYDGRIKGSKGKKAELKPLFPLNKRLQNVAWDGKLKIESHWYIPYHMYESLI
tara:strand:- start:20852 stop:21334 length:483 start_codon:yes stop_codon:yes gene_type:complete